MQTIGRYEIVSVLGEGAMGSVHRGRDTQLGAPVAVKVIHEHLARDPLTLDRFKSEAVIQARLQHPNIVRVQDFVVADGRAAIVMEYVDGRTLSEVLTEQTGPMPYERCLAVMRQVLGAVGHAHRQGIVHRDLKPSNIMVQWYGDELHVKVTDFGIAKILGEEKSRTGTHAKMGTLAYMSPEQIRSPREVDHRADIYSLGCTLYEMATGVTAFDADTEYELMSAIVTGLAPRPRSRYPLIGEGFEGVIVKAMSVDRPARYQSCEEFWRALETIASGVAASFQTTEPGMVAPLAALNLNAKSSPVAVKRVTVKDPAEARAIAAQADSFLLTLVPPTRRSTWSPRDFLPVSCIVMSVVVFMCAVLFGLLIMTAR